MSSQVRVSSGLGYINGDIEIDGVDFTKGKSSIVIDKINSQYSLHEAEYGLYAGHANFSLPLLTVKENDKKMFEIKQFNIDSKSIIKDGLFSTHLEASLDNLYAENESYGPADIKLAIRDLDAKTLATINEQAGQMQGVSEKERQQILFAMLPELPVLLGKGAELEVSKLSIVMPEGEIKGSMFINLPKLDKANPLQLIHKIQGKADLQLPEKIIKGLLKETSRQQLLQQTTLEVALVKQMQNNNEQINNTDENQNNQPATRPMTAVELDQKAQAQAEEKLSALVDAGALQNQGDKYVIKASLADGQLTINGKPFNPAMIQF
jgi:uncharacterized protein YdgA (DUF945 family)